MAPLPEYSSKICRYFCNGKIRHDSTPYFVHYFSLNCDIVAYIITLSMLCRIIENPGISFPK